MIETKLQEELKNKLEEQKNSIQKELESFAQKDPNLKDNWAAKYPDREDTDKDEAGDQVQEYDNMVALEHSLELKLKDVNDALERIQSGTYGVCENCGKTITEERLQACPEARTCLKCNEK